MFLHPAIPQFSCDVKHAIGIYVEADYDAGLATWGGGDPNQLEFAQQVVVFGEGSLTFVNLAVCRGLHLRGKRWPPSHAAQTWWRQGFPRMLQSRVRSKGFMGVFYKGKRRFPKLAHTTVSCILHCCER